MRSVARSLRNTAIYKFVYLKYFPWKIIRHCRIGIGVWKPVPAAIWKEQCRIFIYVIFWDVDHCVSKTIDSSIFEHSSYVTRLTKIIHNIPICIHELRTCRPKYTCSLRCYTCMHICGSGIGGLYLCANNQYFVYMNGKLTLLLNKIYF